MAKQKTHANEIRNTGRICHWLRRTRRMIDSWPTKGFTRSTIRPVDIHPHLMQSTWIRTRTGWHKLIGKFKFNSPVTQLTFRWPQPQPLFFFFSDIEVRSLGQNSCYWFGFINLTRKWALIDALRSLWVVRIRFRIWFRALGPKNLYVNCQVNAPFPWINFTNTFNEILLAVNLSALCR